MTLVPSDPKTFVDCKRAAGALSEKGFTISHCTLETMRNRGGGPPAVKFGRKVLYQWEGCLAWAYGRLRPHGVTINRLAFQPGEEPPAPTAHEKARQDDPSEIMRVAGEVWKWEVDAQVKTEAGREFAPVRTPNLVAHAPA